jgi:hypothetical protein
VHVTIGRIEVRAVGQERMAGRPEGGEPRGVMTIDDYLQRRGAR